MVKMFVFICFFDSISDLWSDKKDKSETLSVKTFNFDLVLTNPTRYMHMHFNICK